MVTVIRADGNNKPGTLSVGLLTARNALIARRLVLNTLECSWSWDEGMSSEINQIWYRNTSIFHVPTSAGMPQ